MNRKRSSGIVGLLLVFLIIAGDLITGGLSSHVASTELCKNPPAGNPNQCHVYTWNSFPKDLGVTPSTGLFNNDTSYYFAFNTTGVIGFTICTQVALGPNGEDGNATLTLQFTPDGSTWDNVDAAGGGTAGSDFVAAPSSTFSQMCSLTVGDFVNFNNVVAGACTPFFPVCEFRIGGNTPMTGPSCSVCQLKFAMMNVQFYYSTTFTTETNSVICNASARSLTGFTNTCTIQIPRSVSTSITVGWRATNATGVGGCGAADNCLRPTGNPGSLTCTISIGANACTNVVTFSPAFTTTTPSVTVNWSPATAGTFNIKPSSSIFPILT